MREEFVQTCTILTSLETNSEDKIGVGYASETKSCDLGVLGQVHLTWWQREMSLRFLSLAVCWRR